MSLRCIALHNASPLAVNPAQHVRLLSCGLNSQCHVLHRNEVRYKPCPSSKAQTCRYGNVETNLVDCVLHVKSSVAVVNRCQPQYDACHVLQVLGNSLSSFPSSRHSFESLGEFCCLHLELTRHAVNMGNIPSRFDKKQRPFFYARQGIPKLVVSAILFEISRLKIVFRSKGRLMGDRMNPFEKDPQDRQPCPKLLVFVVDES